MKRNYCISRLIHRSVAVECTKDNKVIASINKEQITVGEFKKVYEKNLGVIDNEEGRDVTKNLELYINYKKVQQAYSIKLDTFHLQRGDRELQKATNLSSG